VSFNQGVVCRNHWTYRIVILRAETYGPTLITNQKLGHADLLKLAEWSIFMGGLLKI